MVHNKFLTTCVVTGALYLSSFGAVQAATINIVRSDTESLESVHGLRDDTGTGGYDLDGAVITAHYADSSSEQIVWEGDKRTWTNPDGSTYGSINGWAIGDNIDLFMSWDGFEMTTSSLLTSLSIDLAPANTVFDTTTVSETYWGYSDSDSTYGSKMGFPFELYSGYEALQGDINVTYSGIVNLAGADPVGDLFTKMTVDFSSLALGGILGDLDFRTDLDVMRYEGDLLAPVPLGSSMSFLLLGLGGLGLSSRAKKRGLQGRIVL